MTIILVHGLYGFPENCWFPWLRRELESRGQEVVIPAMPNPEWPERLPWKMTIERVVKDPAKTILVGHSLGTLAILNYLADYDGEPFPHVILVAGFGRDYVGANSLVHWFDDPLDFSRIKQKVKRWTSIHSTNDLLVPYAEGVWLAEQLKAKLVTEHKGHLTKRSGATELPSALRAILEKTE